MKVRYYCGANLLDADPIMSFLEPGECLATGVIEVDEDEWNEGMVSIECPKCGMLLEQGNGHFEEASDE
jgi:hypothetical protein